MKNTIVVNKNTNKIYYEGVDRQDCMNAIKSDFMKHIESGLEMSSFPYKVIEVTDDELIKMSYHI